jgi:hypothetical protein
MSLRIAVDIGGTFTDLISFDERSGHIQHAKTLTTPRDPVEGILDCIRKAALDPKSIDNLIHGSTIAINTLIERKGATVGLIVTRGTRDVYIIGRGNRPEAYNLFFHRPRPLVPASKRLAPNSRKMAWTPSPCAFFIRTRIPITSASPERSSRRRCRDATFPCRMKSCANIASTNACPPRSSMLISDRKLADTCAICIYSWKRAVSAAISRSCSQMAA